MKNTFENTLQKIKFKIKKESFLSFIKYLISKLIRILKIGFFCSIFFPVSFLLFILYPIVKVRFGYIDAAVFGTYIFDIDHYLRKKKITNKNYFDFFYFRTKIPMNSFLEKIVKRNIIISTIFRYFFYNACILGGKNTVYLNKEKKISNHSYLKQGGANRNQIKCRDTEDIFFNTKTQLTLSKKEMIDGNYFLDRIGVSKGQKYVCVLARDSKYKLHMAQKGFNSKDHNLNHYYRNSKIDDYALAVKYLLEKGYFVIRMGNITEKKLEIKDKSFFEYSYSDVKSDFLDIFLMGNSYFNLVSESGLKEVSYIYNVPFCFVNCPFPKITTNWHQSIFIYKKFRSKRLNRYLTFKEFTGLANPKNEFNKNKLNSYGLTFFFLDNPDIEIVDNTEEEIKEAVEEMLLRLEKNSWNDELSELEKKFWQNFPFDPNLHSKNTRSRISQKYIKNNKELLK